MISPAKSGSQWCVTPSSFYATSLNGCVKRARSPTGSPVQRSPPRAKKAVTGSVTDEPGTPGDGGISFDKCPRVLLKRLTKEEIFTATGYCISQCNGSPFKQEYEVEEVLAIRKDKERTMFFIKWKNWSSRFNSWETEESVQNCMSLVLDCCIRTNSSYRGTIVQRALRLACKAEDPDVAVLSRLCGFTVPDNGFFRKQQIADMRKEVLRLSTSRPAQMTRVLKAFGSWESFCRLVEERQELAKTIRTWETYIQVAAGAYTTDRAKPLLRVENHVDQEAPPAGFIYIRDFLPGPGVEFPDDPKIGCSCEDCYQGRKGCCPAFNDVRFAYTANGTLCVPFGSPIFECNRLCKCDINCPNRVVQRGCKIPLTIFRTTNGRGWGVRTDQRINKGTFVMEYLGQVITDEDAEKRGDWYDAKGATYLFDLDYHLAEESVDQTSMYTVDAGTFGNIAHFVNHSCEPNMAVSMVWINNLDVRMPRLAFFTKRDICAHEELTVDYKIKISSAATEAHEPKKSQLTNRIRIKCKCGSQNCRKFLN